MVAYLVHIIQQFTVKAHPALFEGEGQTNWGTFSRGFGLGSFRPEILAQEFLSAGVFGLRSFCQLAISTCAEISGRKLSP